MSIPSDPSEAIGNPSQGRDGFVSTLGMLNPSVAGDGLGRVGGEAAGNPHADWNATRPEPRDGLGRISRPAYPSDPSPVPAVRRDGSGWEGAEDLLLEAAEAEVDPVAHPPGRPDA